MSMTAYRTRIAGYGSYLPPKLLTNQDLEKLVDTTDQWITERTGIKVRHIAEDGEVTSDVALKAAERALVNANIKAQELDLIILATVSPDQMMPTTACMLQHKLGCPGVPAFDLGAACSGFIYALSVADQFIRTGMYQKILIVGVEVLHPFMNYKDRETCILFGDGAGAFVVTRTTADDPNIVYSTHMKAEGSLWDLLYMPTGGTRYPFRQDVLDQDLHYFKMKGREIFKNAVRTMAQTCELALKANNVTIDQVDWLVPHQANSRIMEAVADQFNFPKDKVINKVHETANISAATIPVAFQLGIEDGRIKRGDLILFTAFGAGLTAGSALLRF